MQEKLVSRAKELLSDGTVVRVLGWRKGDTDFSAEPAFFETAESLSEFTYDGFCGANLSKYYRTRRQCPYMRMSRHIVQLWL